VPIERVLQADALDEMIDQRQRAQSLALGKLVHRTVTPEQAALLRRGHRQPSQGQEAHEGLGE
jgi:hypothetical protein